MSKKRFYTKISKDALNYLREEAGKFPGDFASDLIVEYFEDEGKLPVLTRRFDLTKENSNPIHITLRGDAMEKINAASKGKYKCIGQIIELAVIHAQGKNKSDKLIDPAVLRPGNAINCRGVNTVVEQVREGAVKVKGEKTWALKHELSGVEITDDELTDFNNDDTISQNIYDLRYNYFFDIDLKVIYSHSCDCNQIEGILYVHQLQNFIADNTDSKLIYTP